VSDADSRGDDRGDDEDFGVRLDWPADAFADPYDGPGPGPAVDEPEPVDGPAFAPPSEPPKPRATPPVMPVTPTPPSMADALAGVADAGGPGLSRALAAIAARVDVLSSTTVTFRNLVSDRYQEQTRWVSELMSETTAEIARATRVQERAVNELRTQVEEVWRLLLEMSASTTALAAAFDAHVTETGAALAGITEELQGIRRRMQVRSRPASDADDAAPAPARRPPRRRT